MFNWQDKRVAVIGGAGFIGSYVVEELVAKGAKVTVLDDLSRGSMDNLASVLNAIEFKRADFMDPAAICMLHNFEVAFCLAAKVTGIHYNLSHNYDMLWHNGIIALNMLEGVRRYVERSVFTSTACVYPHNAPVPTPESYGLLDTPEPTNEGYGWAKRFGERAVSVLRNKEHTKIATTRFFNSITGSQYVLCFADGDLIHEPARVAYELVRDKKVHVPTFDPTTGDMFIRPVSDFVRHHVSKPGFRVHTHLGRSIEVTEDHSLFDTSRNAIEARDLKIGDEILIPRRIPVVEREFDSLNIAERLRGENAWHYFVSWDGSRIEDILVFLRESKRFQNPSGRLLTYRNMRAIPVAIVQALNMQVDSNAQVRRRCSLEWIPNILEVTNDTITCIGRYAAGGPTPSFTELFPTVDVTLSSKGINLAAHILSDVLDITIRKKPRIIPDWAVQLPLSKLEVFFNAFQDYASKGEDVLFVVLPNKKSALNLVVILARLGLVGSIRETEVKVAKGVRVRYHVFIKGLPVGDGDLSTAKIVNIEPLQLNEEVYDFTVPSFENFIGGDVICAHNSYGPRDYFDEETSHVIPSLIKKTLEKPEVHIWGSGKQTRVFVHARDLARGLIRVVEVDECFDEEAINIGHDKEISIDLLYRMICRKLGCPYNPIFDTTQPEGYPRRAADFSLLKRLTEFECTTLLDEGLQETIDWYLSQRRQ